MAKVRRTAKITSIFLITLLNPMSSHALSFKASLKKAAFEKNVWLPSSGALLIFLTGQDGAISDWASQKRPLFNTKQNAANYSDAVAFYYLPAVNLITKGVSQFQNKHNPNLLVHYSSFLMAPALTYLVNRVLKDSTGRMRPDSSNDLSFPSAHASLSSSLNEEFYHSGKLVYSEGVTNGIYAFNEVMVGSVAWARLEARRHHITDVLVGYSLGKFLSHFFHAYFFNEDEQVKLTLDYQPGQWSAGHLKWSF